MSKDTKRLNYVDKALKSIYSEVRDNVKGFYNLKKNGIDGLRDKITKPVYENGNGFEYTADFPSWYQIVGVGTLLNKKRILIADEMGVGKTAQAVAGKLAIQNKSGKKTRTLVVVPNTIKEQWEREINKYCKREQNVVIINEYSRKHLEEAKDADFAIINYDVFGRNGRGKELTDSFMEMGFNYVILDESHNVKNSNAYRSYHIKRLADSADYLCLLSGTPMPNNLRDTYILISMLDPKSFPNAEMVRKTHRYQPEVISALLHDNVVRRTIKEVTDLPPITFKTFGGGITLGQDQQKVYDAILNDDSLDGMTKLQEMRKTLLDPSLVNPEVVYDKALREKLLEIQSEKYGVLDGIIKEKIKNGDKVVIFSSSYRDGVTDKLEKRYGEYGVVRIDGTVPQKDRDKLLDSFQKNPNNNVFIGTLATVGEGVNSNLNAASCVIFIDEPYTSAERKQAIARIYRPGQKKPVEVIGLTVKDSIDEGILKLQEWKEEAERMILDGVPPGPEQNKLLNKIRDYSIFTPIRKYLYTPQQIVARLSTQMKDQGSERIKKALERSNGKIADQYSKNYLQGWETSYSANTSRVYTKVIKELSKHTDLSRKVDLGSGPGILSHVLSEPVTNVELNPKHFDRKFAHPDCKNITSSFHDLKKELADESFDLAVTSLSLDYTSNRSKTGETEREKSVKEINRVLRKDGYLIVTLPDSEIDSVTSLNMQRGMTHLGFEMVPEMSGLVRSATNDADFQVYLGVYRKTGAPLTQSVASDLELKELKRGDIGYAMRKKGVVKDFNLIHPTTNVGNQNLDSRMNKHLELAHSDKRK